MTSSKQIQVRNVVNDVVEKLDFRDRVIKVALGFNNLVVATSSQCYVYRLVLCTCVCELKRVEGRERQRERNREHH